MTLLAVSINHRTAGLDLLARASMDTEGSRRLARELVDHPHVQEALVLSTCNRTEVYLEADRFHGGLEAVAAQLSEQIGVERSALSELCAVVHDEAAVRHCFSLVAGLDSLVVGENQILGQVRDALSSAQDIHSSGPGLNALFQTALRVGKRVQSETSIGAAGRSTLSAAVAQLDEAGIDFSGTRVLVVGAGAMAGLAARLLASRGAVVDCANRTLAKAELLATEVGGQAIEMSELQAAVASHHVVITCTGAAGSLVSAESLGGGPAPRAIVDLAMPPDVDQDVVQRGVMLVNLASLQGQDDADEHDVEAARRLVSSEVQAYLARQRAQAVTPTVVALRQMAAGVVDTEMARLERRTDLDEATAREVRNALKRVSEKLIHSPTVRVREFAEENEDVDYAAALRNLFALEPHHVATSSPDDCPILERREPAGEACPVVTVMGA
ncbi:glutamyl-tRNA reductase [Luteococcus peritonei]|uniref:Glutamyl-tRNA reductase n=1 Tax=Luteococcus peritonei TaxID=88874 RepID=A0ABW4RUZ8_9ACTN